MHVRVVVFERKSSGMLLSYCMSLGRKCEDKTTRTTALRVRADHIYLSARALMEDSGGREHPPPASRNSNDNNKQLMSSRSTEALQ